MAIIKKTREAGEMDQPLRACTAFAEDLSVGSSINMEQLTAAGGSSSGCADALLLETSGTAFTCMYLRCTQAYTYNEKITK